MPLLLALEVLQKQTERRRRYARVAGALRNVTFGNWHTPRSLRSWVGVVVAGLALSFGYWAAFGVGGDRTVPYRSRGRDTAGQSQSRTALQGGRDRTGRTDVGGP